MSLREDRQHQFLRLFLIVDRLQRGDQLSRKQLAQDCNCSERTITRDLAFLKELGVQIDYDPHRRTFCLQAPLPFQSVQFSLSEIVALAVAREALIKQPGSPVVPALRKVFSRISALLPGSLQEALQQTQDVVSFNSDLQRDYSAAPWQELTQVAQRRQTVRICYHNLSRDDLSYRHVDPYLLMERSGYMLLVGYCHQRKEVREFALDRIRQLEVTEQAFTIQPNFSEAEYMKGVVGVMRGKPTRIVVRFDSTMAPYARRRQWQFPHEFEEDDDGSLLLRGEVSGEKGILTELLSWGAGVEVLEPGTLRKAMREAGEAIARQNS